MGRNIQSNQTIIAPMFIHVLTLLGPGLEPTTSGLRIMPHTNITMSLAPIYL